MSNSKLSRRYVTGITLEPSVHAYVDELASRTRTSRSWVLNSIVYEYAMMIERKHLVPLSNGLVQPPNEERVIT